MYGYPLNPFGGMN